MGLGVVTVDILVRNQLAPSPSTLRRGAPPRAHHALKLVPSEAMNGFTYTDATPLDEYQDPEAEATSKTTLMPMTMSQSLVPCPVQSRSERRDAP